jgi:hypothetical protein
MDLATALVDENTQTKATLRRLISESVMTSHFKVEPQQET